MKLSLFLPQLLLWTKGKALSIPPMSTTTAFISSKATGTCIPLTHSHSTRVSTILKANRRGTELSRYKTRTAILTNELQNKQKESQMNKQKLIILENVIRKLQSSNKNLLEKIQELQQEKDGIHLQPESNEIWPPEMEVTLIKEEFQSKEREWENALNMAQVKYQKMKDQFRDLLQDLEDKDSDIKFYQERSKVDDSEINMLREQIETLTKSFDEERELLKEKQNNDDIIEMKSDETQEEQKTTNEEDESDNDSESEKDAQLIQLQTEVEALKKENMMAKEQLEDLSEQWKCRREALQDLIAKGQKDMEALREELVTAKSEYEEKCKTMKLEFEQNYTQFTSMEKEKLAKELSKESVEIATASVRQAEEREKDLLSKLDLSEKQLHSSTEENADLKDKLSLFKTKIENIDRLQQKDAESVAEVEKLKQEVEAAKGDLNTAKKRFESVLAKEKKHLEEEISNLQKQHVDAIDTQRLQWEKKISGQQKEHEERLKELQCKIEKMNHTERTLDAVVNGDKSEIQVVVPVPKERRLGRLVKRVKNVWKK